MIEVQVLNKDFSKLTTLEFKDAYTAELVIDTVRENGLFVKVFVEGSAVASLGE